MDFRQWLAERDQAIAPYLAQLFQQIGADSLREITIESERDGVAVASIDVGGSKKKVTYVWVEGYWVPKSLADRWAASVQELETGARIEPCCSGDGCFGGATANRTLAGFVGQRYRCRFLS